ncbi:MAG: translational GTPase TypA [Candidatus Magasanikbacteria bacterium]|nr:translational GTPase TypA [Candidatus Magasanikbacteria bacterium]
MKIRNIAIIAHVDHGKTTLVDALLRQSNTKLSKEQIGQAAIMDSNDLERERGITIFSKNASVVWNDPASAKATAGEPTKINIIDTPGHADFGGEVERVLKMADGCLLLVDAKEGPMPQTRFVLKKALAMGHRIIVVINKIDKSDARPQFALDKTFELFLELGASDDVANFPVIYAAAKQGKAGLTPDLSAMTDITPLFETIIKYVPEPTGDPTAPLQMLTVTIAPDNFKGRLATGRIYNGSLQANQEIMHIDRAGVMKKYRLTSVMTFFGLEKVETKEAIKAGDIVTIAGIPEVTIGETIADIEHPVALPTITIDEPTVKMTFVVNDSPFAGKEGKFSTSRQIRERLFKELETDVALRVIDNDSDPAASGGAGWIVSGRGELHLAILIERMRREGYEFQVSQPQVINKEENGKTLTPHEQVFIEVPDDYAGIVIQKMGTRRGLLQNMHANNGITSLEFIIPTKGLFGYRTEFLTDTRGLGIINTIFWGYDTDPGGWHERDQGSLVAHETGISNLYGLLNVQDRGIMFIGPGVAVYKGQVVGQNARGEDIRVNICKAKQLSNMRSKGDGKAEHFNTPRTMDLEDALEYIGPDELVEVTPASIRIRKMILDENEARRQAKSGG